MSLLSKIGSEDTCRWVDCSDGKVPEDAVAGGKDSGETLFVGRAEHEGDALPGKVVPSHKVCYVAYGGSEHAKSSYQVLVPQQKNKFDWIPESGGRLPPDAVLGGMTKSGEPLYIGRTSHNGTTTNGKIHRSHGCLYIPYGGQEHAYRDYEVLVCRPTES
ncbi:natterin-3-like isoform X2 [Ornithodoros turicata]